MIDTLRIRASYEIIYRSTGCFHYYSDTVVISRNNNGFNISLGNDPMKLEGALLEKYKKFEYELLHKFHVGACTTLDEYILKTQNHEVLLLQDESCNWNGFENFIGEK